MNTSERINAAIAIFTALYLLVTFFILLATLRANRQSRDNATTAAGSTQTALEMTRDSNAMTRESVEIAKETLELSRRAFELSMRPSLHTGTINQEENLQRLTFHVPLTNKGGTAYDLWLLSGYEIRPRDQALTLDTLRDPTSADAASRGSLGRDDVLHITQSIEAWNAVDLRLRSGEQILYFHATATCRDILGKRFRARFLRQFDPLRGDWPVGAQEEVELPS